MKYGKYSVNGKRHSTLFSTSALSAMASIVVASIPTAALTQVATPTAANTVNTCGGVSLQPSDVTGFVQPLLQGVVTPLTSDLNKVFGLPLLSALGSTTSINVANLVMTQNQNAAPITLRVLANNGSTVAPGGTCFSQATGFTLSGNGGISVGGNQITGLGSTGAAALAGEVNSIAFGNGASTLNAAVNAVAIGTNAAVTKANSVALGTASTANRGAQAAYNAVGLAAQQVSAGEVSIGTQGAERQLTNLAAGSAATDAVNVAQLTGVRDAVTALGQAALQYTDGTHATVALNGTGGSVLTNVRAGTISANSTDAVNGAQLNTVNNAVSTLGQAALQYADGTHASVALNGAGGTVLTNVRAGTLSANSTDAVNGAQLNTVNNAVSTLGQAALQYADGSHTSVALNGTGGTLLTNIRAGTLAVNSTDAVNGAQLLATNDAVSLNGQQIATLNGSLGTTQNQLSGVASDLGTLTQSVGNSIQTLTNGATQTNSDLLALTGTVNGQGTRITANTNAISGLTSDLGILSHTVGDHGIAIQALNDGATQTSSDLLALTGTVTNQGAQLTLNTNAIGTLTGGLTTANGRIDGLSNDLGTLTTTVTNQGTQIVDNTNAIQSLRSISLSGNTSPLQFVDPNNHAVASVSVTGDAAILGPVSGAVRLHNIGDGSIALGSTDAVNGGQLNDTNETIATLAGTVGSQGQAILNNANGLVDVNTRVGDLTATVTGHTNLLDQQQHALDANVDALLTLRRDTENGAVGPVQYSNPLAPTLPNGGTVTNDVTLVGSGGPVGMHNVRDGLVAGGSTDAVNGGQLFALGNNLSQLSQLSVQYDSPLQTAITLGNGIVPVQVHNIRAGTLSALSTDAVNGSQLFATNQTLATLSTSITNLGSQSTGAQTSISLLDGRVTNNTTIVNQMGAEFDQLQQDVANGNIGPVRYSSMINPTTPNGGILSQDLTLVGATAGLPVGLHNVAAGGIAFRSTDAINGGQLFALGNSISQMLGGYAYNPASNSFTGSLSYGGNQYASLQDVLDVLDPAAATTTSTGGGTGTPVIRSTQTKYFHANSVMADSQANGLDSTAVGPDAESNGAGSVAIGRGAQSDGGSSVAIGDDAQAISGKAVSIGAGNIASGDGAVAIGDPNIATGDGATAMGKDNTATGLGAISLGFTNNATGDGSTALGYMNVANGQGAAAIGYQNQAIGLGSIAIGNNNVVTGAESLAIGSSVQTTAADTLAIGNRAAASGVSSVAIGNRVEASGLDAAALGNDAESSGRYSTAIGSNATSSDTGSTALGYGATSGAYASAALGSGAIADRVGSVALGSASQTVRGASANYSAYGLSSAQNSAGEIAIARNISYFDTATGLFTPTGNRQITGLAAGSADTDAVNVAQLRGAASQIGQAVATGLGGGASYNVATNTFTAPTYTVRGVTYNNVGDALSAISFPSSGSGGSGTPSDAVDYDTITHRDITLAPGGTAIHNVAPGAVAAGSTDAVNGDQLNQVAQQVATTTQQVTNVEQGAAGTVQYSNATAPTVSNGGTASNDLTLVGATSNAPVALHNVADGRVAQGSTDAVNGNQLAQTNAQVDTLRNGGAGVVRYANNGSNQPNGGTASNDATLVGATADAPVALHNVAAGNVSTGSTDAVNGGQLAATNARVASVESTAVRYDDSSGSSVTLGSGRSTSGPVALHNVAAGTTATDAANVGQVANAMNSAVGMAKDYTDTRIAAISFDLKKTRRDMNAGTAGAMALSSLPQPYEAGKGIIAMGMATYQGQTAIAVGAARAFNDGHTIVRLGATYNSRKQLGASAAIGYQF